MTFRRNLFTHLFPYILLFIITAIALYITKPVSLQIRWNDETLYYTVAQNIVRHFDFNSNHYLASSIIQKGYPTKDTHLPGYPMILAFGFLIGGINEATPFFVNYLLLILTIFLIFTVGRLIANQWVGFGASLIYLIYPYTLVLTHSVMTEISAAAVIMVVVAILFVQKESFLKGLFLGLAIALAYLIKPFLLTLFITSTTLLWIEKSKHYKKTLLSLLFSFGLLFVTVLIPLSQNQEIYPYAATRILSQSNLTDMLRMIWENFLFNCTLVINFKKFPVYGTITVSMFLLWSITLAVLATASHQKKLQKWEKYTHLCVFSLINFLSALLAFLLLYQYINATRGLSVFSPLMAILSMTSLWLLIPQLKIQKVVASGLGICLCLSYSNFVTFHKLKNLQRRQYQRLYTYSSRLEKVILKLSIQPQVVMSNKNFYLAIANYPTQVIWQLPQTLQELQQVDKEVSIDLIELKDSDPIFQENLQVYGNINLLDNRYILHYQNQGFYYYLQKHKL
ncbi:MAG: glycosyltransferase family 39 protein [Trichodesmium sp. MAG_R01]|nr:glycosyltransferase family 39 protein [Trichodesmium sp. MAG_R01]